MQEDWPRLVDEKTTVPWSLLQVEAVAFSHLVDLKGNRSHLQYKVLFFDEKLRLGHVSESQER